MFFILHQPILNFVVNSHNETLSFPIFSANAMTVGLALVIRFCVQRAI